MAAYYQPVYQPMPTATGYDPGNYQYTANYQYSPEPQYAPNQQYFPHQQYESVPLANRKGPSTKSSIVSINPAFNRSTRSFQTNYTTESKPKSWWWHILSHIVSFLWVVPIATLVTLNWRQHIIGSSVWCPLGHCDSKLWEEDAIARAYKLDRDDHNTLGALQFVSKILEIWFTLIATALIYDLAMIMARMPGGLPVGFILSHLEFTDVRNLLNLRLWTSAIPHRGATAPQRKSVVRLLLFLLFAAFLTVVVNLMGPASAVLALPTLQWIDTPHLPTQVFHDIFLDKAPRGDAALSGCNATELDVGNFSCTYAAHGPSLDQFAASALLTQIQYTQQYSLPIAGTSQESAVLFLVNVTMENSIAWAPNRQVLQDLSHDLFKYGKPELYGDPPTPLNASLSLVINRQGPSIGFNAYCNAGNVSVTNVADDKQIACFSGWTIDNCFRVGEGFNSANKVESFALQNYIPISDVNYTNVDVFFSDRATYFTDDTDFKSGIRRCLDEDVAPSCDWDAIFSVPVPSDLRNMSTNVFTTSYSLLPSDDPSDLGAGDTDARTYCDHVAYLGFPTYTFDATASTNPLNLARMTDLVLADKTPLIIDPDWFLATFSVDRDGIVDQTRPIAQEMMRNLGMAWRDNMNNESYFVQELYTVQLYAITQMMSIVPWSNTTLSSTTPPPVSSGEHILETWATRHVWAFSLNSRTSKFGTAVVLTGIACCLFRLLLGAFWGKREHSPIDLFVAALQHTPTGEFDGLDNGHGGSGGGVSGKGRGGKHAMAKVRYVMEEDDNGKPRFVPERSYMGDFGREATRSWSWGRRSTWSRTASQTSFTPLVGVQE